MTPERVCLFADAMLGIVIVIGFFWLCGVMSRDVPEEDLDGDQWF